MVNVGQRWRPDIGGPSLTVVSIDGEMVTVKRSDDTKRNLSNPRGGQIVAFGEFRYWTLLEDVIA
jgi:hypothetical protein